MGNHETRAIPIRAIYRAVSFLLGELCERFKETREGNLDAAAVSNRGCPLSYQARYGEGHSDTVVALTVDFRSPQGLTATYAQAIGKLLDFRSHAAEVFRKSPEPVTLFQAKLRGAAEDQALFRLGRHHSQ